MAARLQRFHVHGDNIVECERTLRLIEGAFQQDCAAVNGPFGSPVCPSFDFQIGRGSATLRFTLLPGFGRWRHDILQVVRSRGGRLREAADVIISDVSAGYEEPVLAIEYCAALPAGNQAWQRNGRAYSFALARIPFLYMAEIGGYELGQHRSRKAARMPNPAVPFSYLAFSLSQGAACIPVFTASAGASAESRRLYAQLVADSELSQLVRAIILKQDTTSLLSVLAEKVVAFVCLRASLSRRGRGLTPQQWSAAYAAIKAGEPLVDYLLQSAPLSWSKKAYIQGLTPTARQLMAVASRFAVGLTSADLPMCLIPADRRRAFAVAVRETYDELPQEFARWLAREETLTICWVMGFKPRGDDARPDRGLTPMTRMLIGNHVDLLTVVYGPAPQSTWGMINTDPAALMERNGLWEAILEPSDAVLVDSATDNETSHGFLRSHWASEVVPSEPMLVLVDPTPLRYSENDVDTALHLLFARLAGSQIFEGMCNPPGGDWSGISLQTADRSMELRWLSLRRVSGAHAKRPDHVFQIFAPENPPIILAVESKERAEAVEDHIGPRLKEYMNDLLSSPASVQRLRVAEVWAHSDIDLDTRHFCMASAVAFLSGDPGEMARSGRRAEADLVLGCFFARESDTCLVRLVACTEVGERVIRFAKGIPHGHCGIQVVAD